ncbi:MAG: DUF554 domain-containing protein [Actinomycetes bacterium]|jgi:uncharacterized membrane protein YqgA involved in biofilm formation|nr:DUF554 domain-containing protein [Actinomycetes bacterium]
MNQQLFMPGLGVIVNVAAVLLGTGIGLVVGRFISKGMERAIIQAQGIAVIVVGLAGAIPALQQLSARPGLLGRYALLVFVGSLIIGTLAGEALRIERRLEQLGNRLRNFVGGGAEHTVTEGFMTASLIFCVGAMTVLGSIQDGLGQPNTLFVKALLDGTISIFLASSLGFGVALSVIPILVLQGGIALLSGLVGAVVPSAVLVAIEAVGGALIAAVGINLLFDDANIPVGNMLPALFVALGVVWILL